MAVHIRLARCGTKKKPFYRVVVTDQRSPRGGRFLENIGTFDPLVQARATATDEQKAKALSLDHARLAYWQSKGAQPSETLGKLLKRMAKDESAKTATEKAPAKK